MKTSLRIVTLSLILPVLSPVPSVSGADFVWSGTDNNFSNGFNWGGTAPTPSTVNTFTFSGSPTNLAPAVDTSYATSSITFASGAGSYTIGSSLGSTAQNFKFNGGSGTNLITQNSSNAQTINATVYLAANTLNVAGSGTGNLVLNSMLFDSTAAATGTIAISATNVTLGSAAWTGATGATVLSLSATNGSLTFSGATYAGLSLLSVNQSNNNFTISATNPSGFSSATNFWYYGTTVFSGTAAIALTGNIQMAAASQRGLTFSNTAGVTLGSAGSTFGIGSFSNKTLMSGSGVQLSVASGCIATIAANVTKQNSTGVNSTGTTGLFLVNSTGGTLIFTGSNSWDGGITYAGAGGTIQVGNGGTTGCLGTGGVSFNPAASGASSLVYDRSDTLADSNNISGRGTVKQIGTGATILSGSNSYTQATTVSNGTLQFANRLALYSGSTAGWTTSQIVVNSGATLALNVGGSGEFTQADLDILKGLGTSSGGLKNGSYLGIDTTNASTPFIYSSNIANTNSKANAIGLVKLGANNLTLSGSNSYTGMTKVNGGTLQFAKQVALYSGSAANWTAAKMVVNSGATLALNVGGTGEFTQADLDVIKGLGSSTGGLMNGSFLGIDTTNATVPFVYGSDIANTNSNANAIGLVKLGANTLTLSGNNTYSGATIVSAGELDITGTSSNSTVNVNGSILGGNGTVNGPTVFNGGTLNGNGLTLGGLATFNGAGNSLTGIVNANGHIAISASGELNVSGTANGNMTVGSGATLTGSGQVIGTVSGSSATINGSGLSIGATTLNGSSTLSGYNIASSVTVAGGTTSLTGTTQSTSTLSVSTGATLNANGTIAGSANVSGLLKGNSTVTSNLTLTSGTLSPGNSPGITTVEGNFSMDKNSTLVVQVSGTVAGISYDQVKVSRNVSLNGTLDLKELSGLTLGNTITLIDNTGSGTTTGYFSEIITSGSTYTVTTSGSTFTFSVGGTEYLINYKAKSENDGLYNDVSLTVVPEPSTWAMIIGGICMLGITRRLRN